MHAVHHRRVERDDVAVGEGEDGVEVHRRAQLRHPGHHDLLGRALREEGGRDLGDGLARGALAHPHEDHPVADRHDVAALEGRLAPVDLGVAPPGGRGREVRVEAVDRLVDDRLVLAGRPVERVEGEPAVDPARRVARVERVRQRRQEVLAGAGLLAGEHDDGVRNSSGRSGIASPPMRNSARRAGSRVSRNARVESTSPRPTWWGTILRSRSQSRAAGMAIVSARTSCSSTTSTPRARSLADEVGVVALGLLDPHHVVEEQVGGVGRGQPAGAPAPAGTPAPCGAGRPRSAPRRVTARASVMGVLHGRRRSGRPGRASIPSHPGTGPPAAEHGQSPGRVRRPPTPSRGWRRAWRTTCWRSRRWRRAVR